MLTRRTALGGLLGLGAGLGAGLTPGRSVAQTFPTRAVTIVVPYPAGGPVDTVARLYAEEAAADLGRPVTVDNRGGGSGTIGTVAVARAEPDGHMLVLGTNQTHATNQSLLKNCPYDGVKDFAPVAGITVIPHMLVARKSLQVKSVAELVEGAKKMPDAMNYGSTGIGSASHLTAELFKTKAGVDIRHIPFRGAAPMTTELVAERLDIAFATLPSVINLIEAGELKALAIASEKRSPRLPNVPTMKEAGLSGVEADAWFALFAPAKTPQPVIDRLYRSVTAAFGKDKTKAAIAKQGMTLALTQPAVFAAALPAEVKKWAEVIKAAKVSVE
ncbi:MAG: tripartite tricarboxylate transporter substrate binding protein [Pseudorhodoplanes sp.]|nr:tripartite tricarboxylate transporter substrate binding protein [Pseudorhodoplanes sp.]